MIHAVRVGHNQDYAQFQCQNVLLMFQVAVHGNQHIKPPLRPAQKLTIFTSTPAQTSNRGDIVTCQLCGQANGQVFIKKNAHC